MRLFLLKNKNKFFFDKSGVCVALFLLLLLNSCATFSRYKGIGRVRRYTIVDSRLSYEFDSFKIAFISDTHYPSKFTAKRLKSVVRALNDFSPDLLLLGGDYVTSVFFADELFMTLGGCEVPFGKYAVFGNHDFRVSEELANLMKDNGIELLSDAADTIRADSSVMYLCGIRDYKTSELPSWVKRHAKSGFTIVLVHTPDYAQETQMDNVALVFSGHTHGGQVTLFGLLVPETNSKYGKRFLSGLNFTDKNIPVITSNGLGTSRKKIRFCAPSDIVFVTLQSK